MFNIVCSENINFLLCYKRKKRHPNIPERQIVESQLWKVRSAITLDREVNPNKKTLEICWGPAILPNNGKGRCTAIFHNEVYDSIIDSPDTSPSDMGKKAKPALALAS